MNAPQNAPVPGPPSPAALAARAAAQAAGPGDPADHPVTAEVAGLLDEVAAIRAQVADDFDLAALGRQAELLAHAQERLAAALEEAGRG